MGGPAFRGRAAINRLEAESEREIDTPVEGLRRSAASAESAGRERQRLPIFGAQQRSDWSALVGRIKHVVEHHAGCERVSPAAGIAATTAATAWTAAAARRTTTG